MKKIFTKLIYITLLTMLCAWNLNAQEMYKIVLDPYPAMGGTVAGGGAYEYGEIAVFTATPAPNYEFLYWTNADGELFSALTPYQFIVTGNLHLFAHFAPATIEITLSKNMEEGGDIFGAGIYPYGETVIVDAIQNLPQYHFENWTEDGNVVSWSPVFAFTATQSRHFVANFVPATYEFAVYPNPYEGGTVTGGGVYPYGASVTLSAVANEGYQFINWTKFVSGSGTVVSNEPNYTFEVTGGSCSFVAYFKQGEGEVLSIDPIDAGAMMIYPNPTNADMKVVLNDLTLKIVEMELYDYTGKKVHQQTVNQSSGTLPMNGLATGSYILKVYLDQGDVVTWKVVKN